MAYLHTEAKAASNGEYGRGGSGQVHLHWHNMPDATVELLTAGDTRGDIEIRWHLRPDWEGILADLTVDEARTLRDNLTAAIDRFTGTVPGVIDNEVSDAVPVNVDGAVLTPREELVHCRRCGGRIVLVFNGIDYWWTHEPHSVNDHEPVQGQAIACARCGEEIDLIDDGVQVWWVHAIDQTPGHDATPSWTPISSNEEVA
ncbi:hypothetical protein [Nocardia sp. NPDC051981]|uniref:hypothetical protein n=1 Tax=Nocardia sp. NPDC051981 TaxID=3155417 RepID=UPI00343010CE